MFIQKVTILYMYATFSILTQTTWFCFHCLLYIAIKMHRSYNKNLISNIRKQSNVGALVLNL